MAKLLYNLNQDTGDMQAMCRYLFGLKGCDENSPPVVKIKESDWFSPKPEKQKKAPRPGGIIYAAATHTL